MGEEGRNESGFDGEPNGPTGTIDDITDWGNEMDEFGTPDLDHLENVRCLVFSQLLESYYSSKLFFRIGSGCGGFT